jgi:hypothetical protein
VARIPIREFLAGCCASAVGAVISKIVASSQKRNFDFIVLSPGFSLAPDLCH